MFIHFQLILAFHIISQIKILHSQTIIMHKEKMSIMLTTCTVGQQLMKIIYTDSYLNIYPTANLFHKYLNNRGSIHLKDKLSHITFSINQDLMERTYFHRC
uniref:Putative secreted protein n=1 Tax=Panstrongylus lignarius TaxID=156445 RepID=A0A224Y352_9HEMI